MGASPLVLLIDTRYSLYSGPIKHLECQLASWWVPHCKVHNLGGRKFGFFQKRQMCCPSHKLTTTPNPEQSDQGTHGE